MPPSNAPLPEIDEIIRSKRHSFSLEVKPDGRLIVRAPEAATDKQVKAIVAQKTAWIVQTRSKVAKRFPTARPKTFTPGDIFWYLGKQYPLRLTARKRPPLNWIVFFCFPALLRTGQKRFLFNGIGKRPARSPIA